MVQSNQVTSNIKFFPVIRFIVHEKNKKKSIVSQRMEYRVALFASWIRGSLTMIFRYERVTSRKI